MKILIIGYSNLVKKRVIKFFISKRIKFSVASISNKKKINGAYNQFKNYNDGLKRSGAKIVYISLPNSMHYKWAKKSLTMGYHVIVDKPICKNFNQLNDLINLSKIKKKILVEATFFNYHMQIKKLKKNIINKNIHYINSNFIIPRPKKGILVSKKFDGGILMDMGPYISSIPRLFNLKKITSKKVIIKKDRDGLINSIKFFFIFDKLIYSGSFMFGHQYQNELKIYIDYQSLKLERVFSPPDNENLFLTINKKGKIKKIKVKKDNCFGNFFNEVKLKIKQGKYNYYYNRIKNDLFFREKILNVK